MLGLQTDSWSSQTSSTKRLLSWFSPTLSDDSTALMQRPKSPLTCRQPFCRCLPQLWAAAGEEMPPLNSSQQSLWEFCLAKHLACNSGALGTQYETRATEITTTRSARSARGRNAFAGTRLHYCAKHREASLCLAFPHLSAHEVKLCLLKQTVKQMGYYVHLLYLQLCIIMITGRLSWTVQAVKGGQLCFTSLFHTKQIQKYPIA